MNQPVSSGTGPYYSIKFLLSLVTDMIEPVALNANLKRQPNITPEQRRIMVEQTIINRAVGLAIKTVSSVGVGLTVERVFKNRPNRGMLGIYASLLSEGVIGKLIIKPFVMSKVTSWWEGRRQAQALKDAEPTQTTLPTTTTVPMPQRVSAAGHPMNPGISRIPIAFHGFAGPEL